MKKFIILILIILVLLLLTLFLTPKKASAHFTKVDGSMTVLMHIDPDDDPIVGEQAGFYFEFRDQRNQFKPTHCDCTFSIVKNKQEIYSQPLFQNNPNPSLSNLSLIYIFPERNVYQVKVVGKPSTPGMFEPFTVTYAVRLERISRNQQSNPQDGENTTWIEKYFSHLGHIIMILVLFAGFVVFAVIQKQNEKKSR